MQISWKSCLCVSSSGDRKKRENLPKESAKRAQNVLVAQGKYAITGRAWRSIKFYEIHADNCSRNLRYTTSIIGGGGH